MERDEPSRGVAASLAVAAAFVGLGLAGVLQHEPWRDELEIWLIARDSASLPELLVNMGTEAHPALWYLMSWLLARVTHDPLALQLVNLALGAAAALVFFRAAPFGLAVRLLFVFSYYALFEFTVIARSYALELLLLLVFCAHASRRDGRIDLGGAVLLVLLAGTNLFGAFMAGALVAVDGVRAFTARELRVRGPALGLAGAGVALAVGHVFAQTLRLGPTHAGAYRAGADLDWLLACLSTLAFGALPLPDPTSAHPWNSSVAALLPTPWNAYLPALASLVLAAAAWLALRAQPRWLAAFALGAAPMLGLVLFVWYGSQRHHGQPFLWFLACAWLASKPAARRGRAASGASEVTGGLPRRGERILAGVLAVQVLAAGWLLAADLARPFSNARAAAAWLEEPARRDAVLVGARDYAVQPIAAYLSREIYYPDQGGFGTFMHWGESRVEVRQPEIEAAVVELVEREGRPVLLVLSGEPGAMPIGAERALRPGIRIRLVARFEGAIVADESYRVFEVEAVPPSS